MVITDITEFTKTRSKIYLNDSFAFVLYKGEIRRYGLKVGHELSENLHHEILDEVLVKRAKLRAMSLLKGREYTTAQLRTKLKQGLYPDEVIEKALSYVAFYHYTDDERYATDFIRVNNSRKSRRRMEQDLIKKGISTETIASAFAQCEQTGDMADEEVLIAKLLRKKNFDRENADPKEIQKIYGFLIRRGFSGEHIRHAMRISDSL